MRTILVATPVANSRLTYVIPEKCRLRGINATFVNSAVVGDRDWRIIVSNSAGAVRASFIISSSSPASGTIHWHLAAGCTVSSQTAGTVQAVMAGMDDDLVLDEDDTILVEDLAATSAGDRCTMFTMAVELL